MSFDFKKSLIKVQGGRSYLPVSARIVWFRQEHPDWGIHTEPVEINHEKQFAVFRASIYNAEGRLMATGTKKEDVKGFPDWMEKAETGSVGRALALCGFGTQFSPELDEATNGRFADSPQPTGGGRFGGGSNYSGGNGGNNYNGGNSYGSGASRYGAPPQRDAAPARDNAEFTSERPAPARSEAPRQETPRQETPRPQPSRPAPTPVSDDGEDDFESLIGGAELLDTNEDDPFGDDSPAAPKTVAAPKPSPAAKADTAPSGTPACNSCGKALTKAQQELSIRNYGEAFCPTCQREKTRRPALAER